MQDLLDVKLFAEQDFVFLVVLKQPYILPNMNQEVYRICNTPRAISLKQRSQARFDLNFNVLTVLNPVVFQIPGQCISFYPQLEK